MCCLFTLGVVVLVPLLIHSHHLFTKFATRSDSMSAYNRLDADHFSISKWMKLHTFMPLAT